MKQHATNNAVQFVLPLFDGPAIEHAPPAFIAEALFDLPGDIAVKARGYLNDEFLEILDRFVLAIGARN